MRDFAEPLPQASLNSVFQFFKVILKNFLCTSVTESRGSAVQSRP